MKEVQDKNAGDGIILQPNGNPVLFAREPSIQSLQFDLQMNLNAFDGTTRLVHHVQNTQNYHFMEIHGKKVSMGHIANGNASIENQDQFEGDGWLDVRLISDGTHFRGYINQKMVVHGHGKEPAPGLVGLSVRGKGSLFIKTLRAQSLR
jgi:hypothetical protein